ncbi:DUF1440 domain-containing protein [Bordetella avium]|nr:DUF1440 domain-containing protein [Bordetella avium]RIQ17121.1 DUF1440 domain-containing protein [Bordetella avium]RIQ36153.1 DUF1440 domain-containing protein [Bordetella avium]RIQ39503.1 DUF1440 domain-containing protein [Bordetella avium]RIQ44302.1 DUF1440 domain-containing protein [Bordetella avium]
MKTTSLASQIWQQRHVAGGSPLLLGVAELVQTCGGACERKHSLSVLIGFGIWAGFLSALVKSGVETLLPPRPPGAVPPPIGLLNLMGFDAGSMNYAFNQAAVNWGGNGVHILFSMVMAFVYVRLMEVCSKVGIWWGLPFAWLTATIGAHGIVFPLLGIGPLPWHIGVDAYISEFFGTALWIWTIECMRRVLLRKV